VLSLVGDGAAETAGVSPGGAAPDSSGANESFLVNGSLSQGIQQQQADFGGMDPGMREALSNGGGFGGPGGGAPGIAGFGAGAGGRCGRGVQSARTGRCRDDRWSRLTARCVRQFRGACFRLTGPERRLTTMVCLPG